MEKEKYTVQEIEEMLKLYGKYSENNIQYAHTKDNPEIGWSTKQFSKSRVNESADKCFEKIPKNLTDKLNIKKIK